MIRQTGTPIAVHTPAINQNVGFVKVPAGIRRSPPTRYVAGIAIISTIGMTSSVSRTPRFTITSYRAVASSSDTSNLHDANGGAGVERGFVLGADEQRVGAGQREQVGGAFPGERGDERSGRGPVDAGGLVELA